MTSRRLLFVFLGVLTGLRMLYLSQIELSPDEAYYYQWSERLDWSYFSKGPGVATAMWLSTHLFGVSESGVRFFSPLLSLGTSLLLFGFARRLYGESVGIWAALLINLIPIFNVGSLVLTIDPLSIFFWMAALYTFWMALEKSPEFSGWWPATGALIGCGFLAKYTNAMQLISILLVLVCTSKYRRELIRPGFYSMLAVFAIFMLPPVIWNSEHDWITLHHLSARGGLEKATSLDAAEFFTFLGAHFGVYSPLIFGGLLLAIVWGWPRMRQQFKPRFLLLFTLPLFVLYFALSFKQAGEANWTAPATLSLTILAVALWHEKAQEKRWARIYIATAASFGLVMSLVTVDTELLRRIGIPLSYDYDPSTRLRGWETATEKVEAFRRDYEAKHGEKVFLIANKYGTAAALSFYLKDKRVEGKDHPPIYVPESQVPENQYFFWPRYDENVQLPPGAPGRDEYYTEELGANAFLGRTALYITDRAEGRPPTSIKGGFERVEMIACIDFARHGLPMRQIRIFACHRYRQVSL